MKKKNSPAKKSESIEITLPENLTSYLTPIIMVILFIALWFKIDSEIAKVNNSLDNIGQLPETLGAVEPQPELQPSVELADIQALYEDDTRIAFGDGTEDVIFVEVSDPSCPYCSIASGQNPELNKRVGEQFTIEQDGGSYIPPVPEMKKLAQEGKAGFIYIFQNGAGGGTKAAEAMYCAHNEGKFWEAHNLIMSPEGYAMLKGEGVENFQGVTNEQLASLLSPILKESEILDCLNDGRYTDLIQRDMETARSIGAGGTPAFFINETVFAGAYSFEDMRPLIEQALSK